MIFAKARPKFTEKVCVYRIPTMSVIELKIVHNWQQEKTACSYSQKNKIFNQEIAQQALFKVLDFQLAGSFSIKPSIRYVPYFIWYTCQGFCKNLLIQKQFFLVFYYTAVFCLQCNKNINSPSMAIRRNENQLINNMFYYMLCAHFRLQHSHTLLLTILQPLNRHRLYRNILFFDCAQ